MRWSPSVGPEHLFALCCTPVGPASARLSSISGWPGPTAPAPGPEPDRLHPNRNRPVHRRTSPVQDTLGKSTTRTRQGADQTTPHQDQTRPRTNTLLKDCHHPGHKVIQWLPSGKLLRSQKARAERLRRGFSPKPYGQ